MSDDLMLQLPIEIKGKPVRNRIAYAPMVSMMAENGMVTEKTLKWYEGRIQGDVGLCMVEGTNVSPDQFLDFMPQVALHDDKFVESHKSLVDLIHSYDCHASIQLAHGGMMAVTIRMFFQDFMPQLPTAPHFAEKPWMPVSGLDLLKDPNYQGEAMSTEKVRETVMEFASSARRAKEAGYDSVEIHGAHGVLIGNFLSPFYNLRTDRYGGSLERRMRFCLEIVEESREAVGKDFPLLIRLSVDEMLGDLGNSVDDYITFIVPRLVEAGVDCFDVSMGSVQHVPDGMFPSVYYRRGYFMYLARLVKKIVPVPVIGVGRINDMQQAEYHLRQGDCDIVYMGRQLFADSDAPRKFFEGRAEETRRCIGCLQTNGATVCIPCTVNPELDNVYAAELTPAEAKKRVVIAGAGPAGMEAARIAAERGHEVIVLERREFTGGTVRILGNNTLMHEFKNLNDYHSHELKRLGVDVRTGVEATAEGIAALKPDLALVACGAQMSIPEAARDKPFVLTHVDALENKFKIGRRAMVYGLGYGAELAIALQQEGHEVTLAGKADTVATNLSSAIRRQYLMRKLDPDVDLAEKDILNIRLLKRSQLVAVDDDGWLTLKRKTEDGEEECKIQVDTLIISMGRKSNNALVAELEQKGIETIAIGDAKNVREIHGTLADATQVARGI
jgi:2,4-dienoyl-CoA reductase-like NADH-dependent reductase (Old Yellow Enzyme family)/thioredoxin reductase